MNDGKRYVCEKIWAENKYLVLSKSHIIYEEIRKYLKREDIDSLELKSLIDKAIKLEENPKAMINSFQHIWGYFKKIAQKEEKKEFLLLVEKYKEGLILKEEIINYLKLLLEKYPNEYLKNSNIFKLGDK